MNVTGPLNVTGPPKETEGTLVLAAVVPDVVLDPVPDAEPVTVAAAGAANSRVVVESDEDSESLSTRSAAGSALRRGKTRGDRDLCDRRRETEFSVSVSYIPLNLS